MTNNRKDVLFSTNLSKLFVWVFNDFAYDVVNKRLNLFQTKQKGMYVADIVLDNIYKLKKDFEEKNISSNIDEILEKIISIHGEIEKMVNEKYSYLYRHQKNILPKLLTFHSYGMFWDMGTGKTLTSLIYMKEASKLGLKFLVLVPDKVLLKQWIYEGEKWNVINPAEWNVINGNPHERKVKWLNMQTYKYNITTLPLLRHDIEFVVGKIGRGRKEYNGIIPLNDNLKGKFVIIVDEASKVKNANTKTYRCVMALRLWSRGLIALTGTPYENNLSEVYNICKLIKPLFMKRSEFEKKHVLHVGSWNQKYVEVDKFIERIRTFSEIVKKKDVVELPPIKETWIKISTLENRTEFLDAFRSHYIGYSESVLGFINILKMLDSYFGNWKYSKSDAVKDFDFSQYKATNEKFRWLYEFLGEVNAKVVIVTYYRGTFEMLSKLLERLKEELNIKQIFLMGDGRVDKFKVIRAFKESKGKSILLATSTIDYGVDLPEVDYLINFDIHYNPARLRQRRDRIYRIGTKNKTFVYYLYGDLIEDSIYNIVISKEEVIAYLEGHKDLTGEYLNSLVKEWQENVAKEYDLKIEVGRKKKEGKQ